MHITPRSYLTSGIAALGVGAIALAPIQPIPNQVALAPQRVVSELGVELAAAVDPIQAWVNTFETTFANIGILGEFYMQKPFPLLQTIGANVATYFEELTNGNVGVIPGQIWDNVVKFFEAPWSPGDTQKLTPIFEGGEGELDVPKGTNLTAATPPIPAEFPDAATTQSPLGLNTLVLQYAAGFSVTGPQEEWQAFLDFGPVWSFLNTPYAGQLLGLVGPIFAPLISLTRSFTAIGEYFEAGDVQSALFELINIPANMTNAFFNGGGFLDLTGIVAGLVPDLLEGTRIGINTGGLLNAVPAAGPDKEWTYGAGWDSLAILGSDAGTFAAQFFSDQPAPGFPNGWFGNAIGLGQYLADQMLVTPAPPPAAEPPAETAAAIQAAPVDLAPAEAPATESAPVVDAPAPVEESAPVEVVEESATVVDDAAEVEAAVEAAEVEAAVEAAEVEAAVEAVEAEVEAAEVEAVEAEATAPADEASGAEAVGDQSDGNTGRAGSGQRGAR